VLLVFFKNSSNTWHFYEAYKANLLDFVSSYLSRRVPTHRVPLFCVKALSPSTFGWASPPSLTTLTSLTPILTSPLPGQQGVLSSRRRGINIPHPMTSAEKQAFLAGIRLKTNWELGRLRGLHPGLQDHELIFKAHKAVVDHWFEFEKSSDPRRKIVESHLIEKFFEDCKKQLAEKRRPPSLTITTSFGADFDSVCASPPAESSIRWRGRMIWVFAHPICVRGVPFRGVDE
jgi:hypothetical protein